VQLHCYMDIIKLPPKKLISYILDYTCSYLFTFYCQQKEHKNQYIIIIHTINMYVVH